MYLRLVSSWLCSWGWLWLLICLPPLLECWDYSFVTHSLCSAKEQTQSITRARPTISWVLFPAQPNCLWVLLSLLDMGCKTQGLSLCMIPRALWGLRVPPRVGKFVLVCSNYNKMQETSFFMDRDSFCLSEGCESNHTVSSIWLWVFFLSKQYDTRRHMVRTKHMC